MSDIRNKMEELKNEFSIFDDPREKYIYLVDIAKKSLEAFGSDSLKSLLQETGFGNHPEIIRFMYRAGKAISEDSYVGNSQGANAKGNGIPKDFNGIANALYSNQQNK